MIKSLLLIAAGAALPLTASTIETATEQTPRDFPIHSIETAPEGSKAALEGIRQKFGFVPNLAGVMSESPALLASYFGLQDNLQAMGRLSPAETNVIQLSIAVENQCRYCTSGHTMAGKLFFQTPDEVMNAIRAGEPIDDPKLGALQSFALSVYESRGRVDDQQLAVFYAAGYDRSQALEVVANIAAKVMTNFTNQLVGTPLDEALKPFAKDLPFGS